MNRPAIDAERIAALIDGRLDDAQRAALLAEIDASPEAFEVYTDAIAALRDSESSGVIASSVVVPIDAHRTRRRPSEIYRMAIGLAAVFVIAIGISILRRDRTTQLSAPHTMVAFLDQQSNLLSTIELQPPWSELRGAGDTLSPTARAARLGARIIDLELLAKARDSAFRQVAQQIAALLDGIPAGSVAAAEYRALAEREPGAISDNDLRRASTFAEQVAGPAEVRMGAWLEVARIAAARRDSIFFRSEQHRRELEAVRSAAAVPRPVRDALTRLESAIRSASFDWVVIRSEAAEALRQLASP